MSCVNVVSFSLKISCTNLNALGFPGGAVVKNPSANAGDTVSIPGQGTKILHAVWRGQNKQTTYNGKKSEKE